MDTLRLLTRGTGIKIDAKSTVNKGTTSRDPDPANGQTKKRKRELQDHDHLLDDEEIRRLHKSHMIRITNLRSTQISSKKTSRKSQKDAARLFPQPLQDFSALSKDDVNHYLLTNILNQGYRQPTEVQLATIPLLMVKAQAEPDLLTVAPTGSGKTLAFLIPVLAKTIKARRSQNSAAHVSSIILAPTKELVNQIVNEGRKLAANTGVRVTAFRKGMKLHSAIQDHDMDDSDNSGSESGLAHKEVLVKADIIVSTPLSLVHAITPDASSTLQLPHIVSLILDEADVLLDQLFREQTLSIWSACSNPLLRVSLWSATIGSNIEELAIETISTRQSTLKVDVPLLRCIIGLKDTSLPNISHKLIYASTEPGKLTGLRNIIRPATSTDLRPPFLIFTQTIDRAQALYKEIQYDIPSSGTPRVASLHSSLSTPAREKIMQDFRLGKIWILITTDLLSRGIDFRGVNVVINYDIPTTVASYVHRAGRTGRAQREGSCLTLYTQDDVKYLRGIANVIKKSGSADDVPNWLVDALPVVGKNQKKDLKIRGVDVRRAVKESDDKSERRRKGRNVVGTTSGYEKKLQNRRQGMIEGSKRRQQRDRGPGEDEEDTFGGFD